MRLELWQRNLAALFVGQTMTAIAFSFIFPFIPLYVQVLGVTGTTEAAQWAGTIAAAAALAMAVTQPIWGNMADRWGRKPMVVRAMLGGGGTIILMGFATSPEQLLFLRFVQGCLMGTMAASTALVAASTPRDRLGFALGLIQVAMFVGNSLGPLVGGLIADTLGYRIAFQLAGGLMLVAAALVITVVREQFVRPQGGAAHDGVWTGSRAVLSLAFFPMLVIVIFLIQLGGVIVGPMLSLFVAELHAAENAATQAGIVIAATGAVSAISAVVIGRISDRAGRKVILTVCLAGAALAYFPQGLVQQVWQLLVLRMLLGIFLGGLMPTANALVAGLVPEERRGAAYALTTAAGALSGAVGPLLAAGIVTHLGLRAVFFTTAGVFAVVWLWVGLWLQRNDLPQQYTQLPVIPAHPGDQTRADAD